MASIAPEGTLNIGDGILHPMFAYGFKVELSGGTDLLTSQVTKCVINLHTKRLSLWVEQPKCDCGMFELIQRICDTTGYEIRLTPGEVPALEGTTVAFANAKAENHSLELDYGVKHTAKHMLVFSYTHLYTK